MTDLNALADRVERLLPPHGWASAPMVFASEACASIGPEQTYPPALSQPRTKEMAYDHIVKDLCRKAADDVADRIALTTGLLSDPADRMMVAIYAAGSCLANASGHIIALTELEAGSAPDVETAVDALWEMVRPVVVSSSGGSRDAFNALLAKTKDQSNG